MARPRRLEWYTRKYLPSLVVRLVGSSWMVAGSAIISWYNEVVVGLLSRWVVYWWWRSVSLSLLSSRVAAVELILFLQRMHSSTKFLLVAFMMPLAKMVPGICLCKLSVWAWSRRLVVCCPQPFGTKMVRVLAIMLIQMMMRMASTILMSHQWEPIA